MMFLYNNKRKKMKKKYILSSMLLLSTASFAFDLNSFTKSITDTITKSTETTEASKTSTSNSLLSNDTISSGLKEALSKGVDFAVKELGSENGYLKNPSVKIPLPDNLAKIETLVRKAGGDEMVDDLITSINNAATTAAPKTANILLGAVKDINLEDATKILSGNNTAATEFVEKNTTEDLKKLINPIIENSMKENQVAKYYTIVNDFYKSNVESYTKDSSIMEYASKLGVDSYLPKSSDEDLNGFVTQKAISGLFKMIAEKESAIRENPIEQTTSLLKEVFAK